MNKFAAIFLLATGILIGYVKADACIVCDSEHHVDCVTDPISVIPRNCRTQNQSGCFTRIVGTRTLRGCVDEMDENQAISCGNETTCEICHSFTGNVGCNSNVYPQNRLTCHQCSDSLNSNFNCSVVDVNPKACRTFNEFERCYIRKTNDAIERGCLSETNKCPRGTECYLCDGHGCNNLNANSTEIPLDSAAAVAIPSILMCVLALIATKLR